MMNSPQRSNLPVFFCLGLAALLAGCSAGLTPPFPEIAPFPTKVLSKAEQDKAIGDLNAAKDAQAKEASQGAVLQPAVAKSGLSGN